MTSNQLRRSRLAVGAAIVTTAILLLLALWAIGPKLISNMAASYAKPSFRAEQTEYCPGDVLRFSYVVEPRYPGPVEIMAAWCNVQRGTCLLDETTVKYAIIAAPRAAITATTAITIPRSASMQPGAQWQYVRSVRQMGERAFDMFTVPFIISPSCD